MQFNYKARTKEGKLQGGVIEAASRQSALEVLQRHQLTALSLDAVKSGFSFSYDIKVFSGVGRKDLVGFFRSFSSLFEAGVPIVEGLRILADQTENKNFRVIIIDVVDKVDGGMKLSQAISHYPNIFSEFHINMIKAGESSGALQKTLLYLADYTEREYQLRANVRNAMLYPAFIITVFITVFFIMMVFVVPRLAVILGQLVGKDKLPFITRALLAVSKFTNDWIIAIVLLLVGGIGFAVYYLKTPQGKEWWDDFQLRVPIFKNIFRQIYQTRFADNLSTLIAGGIPIIEAIAITANIVNNKTYQRLIYKIGEEVKAGNSIESVVRFHEEFSPFLVQMIAVGKRSGKLEDSLAKVAGFFQKEVDRSVAGLTTLIEPLLIVVMGVGVGFLVASIMIPIYSVISGGLGS